jgi:hypothetical protein
MTQHKILKADAPINEEQLDRLAQEGWTLIEILPHGGWLYFYFRREES